LARFREKCEGSERFVTPAYDREDVPEIWSTPEGFQAALSSHTVGGSDSSTRALIGREHFNEAGNDSGVHIGDDPRSEERSKNVAPPGYPQWSVNQTAIPVEPKEDALVTN